MDAYVCASREAVSWDDAQQPTRRPTTEPTLDRKHDLKGNTGSNLTHCKVVAGATLPFATRLELEAEIEMGGLEEANAGINPFDHAHYQFKENGYSAVTFLGFCIQNTIGRQ